MKENLITMLLAISVMFLFMSPVHAEDNQESAEVAVQEEQTKEELTWLTSLQMQIASIRDSIVERYNKLVADDEEVEEEVQSESVIESEVEEADDTSVEVTPEVEPPN